MSNGVPAKVVILGKEFRIACQEDERDDLMAAARYVDEKMRQIRSHSQISGLDRIAVMAALNIAHELTQAQNAGADNAQTQQATEQVVAMREKVEALLRAHAKPD